LIPLGIRERYFQRPVTQKERSDKIVEFVNYYRDVHKLSWLDLLKMMDKPIQIACGIHKEKQYEVRQELQTCYMIGSPVVVKDFVENLAALARKNMQKEDTVVKALLEAKEKAQITPKELNWCKRETNKAKTFLLLVELALCVRGTAYSDLLKIFFHYIRAFKEHDTSNLIVKRKVGEEFPPDKDKGVRITLKKPFPSYRPLGCIVGDIRVFQVDKKKLVEIGSCDFANSTKAIYFLVLGEDPDMKLRLSEHIPYAHFSSYTSLEEYEIDLLSGPQAIRVQKRFLPDMDLNGYTLFRLSVTTETGATRSMITTGIPWITAFTRDRVVGTRYFFHHRSTMSKIGAERVRHLDIGVTSKFVGVSDIAWSNGESIVVMEKKVDIHEGYDARVRSEKFFEEGEKV